MVPLSYIVSVCIGTAVVSFFVWGRHTFRNEWPDFTDCLLVWGAVFGMIQAPLTAFSIVRSLGPDLILDAVVLLGYGLISGLGLAVQEIYKKFKGRR